LTPLSQGCRSIHLEYSLTTQVIIMVEMTSALMNDFGRLCIGLIGIVISMME
jgi:hypothetical protein